MGLSARQLQIYFLSPYQDIGGRYQGSKPATTARKRSLSVVPTPRVLPRPLETEASTERRRQEGAALTARKALLDGRRDWASEKDTLMAAVREAGHRAELAEGEATEAKVFWDGGGVKKYLRMCYRFLFLRDASDCILNTHGAVRTTTRFQVLGRVCSRFIAPLSTVRRPSGTVPKPCIVPAFPLPTSPCPPVPWTPARPPALSWSLCHRETNRRTPFCWRSAFSRRWSARLASIKRWKRRRARHATASGEWRGQ